MSYKEKLFATIKAGRELSTLDFFSYLEKDKEVEKAVKDFPYALSFIELRNKVITFYAIKYCDFELSNLLNGFSSDLEKNFCRLISFVNSENSFFDFAKSLNIKDIDTVIEKKYYLSTAESMSIIITIMSNLLYLSENKNYSTLN